MEPLSYDFKKLNPREKRLAKEHISVDELCMINEDIDYKLIRQSGENANIPPEVYHITYNVKSIVGINEEQNPIYDQQHEIEISLPREYPVKSPKCKVLTNIWHPNIKSEGQYKGRICSNTKEFGKLYNLDLLILRIQKILAYKNYHAVNVAPYPEDEKVARWVRDFAEPKGIVTKGVGLTAEPPNTDYPPITEPIKEIEPQPQEPPKRIKIKVSSTNRKPNQISTENLDKTPNLKISIKRKK